MNTETNLFLERTFDAPISAPLVLKLGTQAASWCYELHQVRWRGSFLARHGRRMICWFAAPDAESIRVALRQLAVDARVLWPGTVHEAPVDLTPNVLVERRFEFPVLFEDIQSLEEAGASCLATHRVEFVRTFFSADRKRMICLYAAPDAEAVRVAQREAGMPVETVWSCERIEPDMRAD